MNMLSIVWEKYAGLVLLISQLTGVPPGKNSGLPFLSTGAGTSALSVGWPSMHTQQRLIPLDLQSAKYNPHLRNGKFLREVLRRISYK